MKAKLLAPALLLAAGTATANAAIVDMTHAGASEFLGGTLFETVDFTPVGTGVIDPIVRMQRNGTEQGYNTSGRGVPFDEKTDPNYTHDLQLSSLVIKTIGVIDYYEFRLDINQINSGAKRFLSLDEVQIYTSPIGSQTTTNVASLGALRYDLDADADNWVKMDYDLASGSGWGDLCMFVPVSKFAGSAPSDFVYLYSQFGLNHESNDGFEEWWAVTSSVPSPGSLTLTAAGLLLLARRRRGQG